MKKVPVFDQVYDVASFCATLYSKTTYIQVMNQRGSSSVCQQEQGLS